MAKTFEAFTAFVAVPWAFFVAAFLYTVVFTLVVISGVDLPAGLVVAGYGLPVALYALVLVSRLVHAVAVFGAHVPVYKPSSPAMAR